MALSDEMRLLRERWRQGTGWPKRLDWIEIRGIRGWTGERVPLNFPIVALVGENGCGKSTVLQCIASIFRNPTSGEKSRFASEFFPDTPWDAVRNAEIRYSIREGTSTITSTVRRPSNRWLGNTDRRLRRVEFIDLSRVQPVGVRRGYARIAKPGVVETSAEVFDEDRRGRASAILGRQYDSVKMALSSVDSTRAVPVMSYQGQEGSGFHLGAGEIMVSELLQTIIADHSIVLIDEIETSLHPRAQRRLIRDLARITRDKQIQIIVSTHSPYILEELPEEGRLYIVPSRSDLAGNPASREIVTGVSPYFAMTKMDLTPHSECDVYVEDERAATLVREILATKSPDSFQRCQLVPYGAASVGRALGIMASQGRFPRPSCVFVDGDQPESEGCSTLPGGDAPERVIFGALSGIGWPDIHQRVGRSYSDVVDSCRAAMVIQDHHEWIRSVADRLLLGGDHLWRAMCAVWVVRCLSESDANSVTNPIELALVNDPP